MAATPNTIAPNTKIQFRSFVICRRILHKKYNNCHDASLWLISSPIPRYPNNPDRVDLETTWEYPPGGVGRVAADPVRNYMTLWKATSSRRQPAITCFYVCGDDEYYLYLSTDESPANMYQICSEPGGWSDNRAWCPIRVHRIP